MKKFCYAQKIDSILLQKTDSISKVLSNAYSKASWSQIGNEELTAGDYFYKKKLYIPAIEHYEAAEKAYTNDLNSEGLLNAYFKLGKLYYNYHYGENSKALKYYLKAFEMADSLNNDNMAYVILGSIGSIYSLENRHEEGLKYLFMAIARLNKLNNKKSINTFYGNIANIYIQKHNYDSAYYYYNISNKLCIEASDTLTLMRNYVNMANLSIRDNKYDKAIDFLHQSLELSLLKDNLFGIAISYNLMAKAYLAKKEYQKAENYAKQSLAIGEKIKSSNRIMSSYRMLWKLNEAKENYKEALKYLSLYKSLKDSVEQQKENDQITHLISDFETQKNLHEIKLLRTENSLKESQLKNKNTLLVFILISTIIILLSGSIFVLLFLKKKKAYLEILRKNIELEKKETKEEEILIDGSQKIDKADIALIESWKEKIVKAGLFKNPSCTIELCAQELNTNRSYLSRAINQFYGQNFNSIINELRIKDARKLLRQKEAKKYTIEFIAQQVGFNNKVSFTSSFKKITGLTPAFYRDHAPLVDDISIA
jgi:AraC-like DNA-binding protein